MLSYPGGGKPLNGTFKAVERWQSHQLRCPKDLDELLRGFRPLFAYHDHLLEGREIPLATVEEFFKTGAVSQFSGDPKDLMLLQGQRNCYEYLRERVLARDDLETSLVLEVHRILTSGTYTEPFYLVNGERPGELKKRDYVTAVNAVGAAARDVGRVQRRHRPHHDELFPDDSRPSPCGVFRRGQGGIPPVFDHL